MRILIVDHDIDRSGVVALLVYRSQLLIILLKLDDFVNIYIYYLAQKQIIELLSREQEPSREICTKITKYCKSYLVRQNITVMGMRNCET